MNRNGLIREIYWIISDNYNESVVAQKDKLTAEEILTKVEEVLGEVGVDFVWEPEDD